MYLCICVQEKSRPALQKSWQQFNFLISTYDPDVFSCLLRVVPEAAVLARAYTHAHTQSYRTPYIYYKFLLLVFVCWDYFLLSSDSSIDSSLRVEKYRDLQERCRVCRVRGPCSASDVAPTDMYGDSG